MRAPALAALLALPCVSAPAQARTDVDRQLWLNATILKNPRTDTGFTWFVEVQPRFGDDAKHLRQLLLRGAAGWKLSPKVSVYAGYMHLPLPRPGPDRNEERVFAQLSWTPGTIAGGAVSTRARLEHRRLSNGTDTGWRARAMLRYAHPLGAPERVRALVWSELFWNFDDTDWGARKGFDQIRAFAGIELPVGGRNTLELGYLNQILDDPGGNRRMNHVASLSLFIRP